MLRDDYIVYKGIWLRLVLPFCVEQDLPLKFLDGCSSCKGIWLLHALPFRAEQDFPLLLFDSRIACKGTWLLHVLPQRIFYKTVNFVKNCLKSAKI